MTDDKMLARIAALLRQAESTDNPHEADAFMAAAQRLATATSIDLAVARSHSANRTPAQMPVQRTITIGNAGTRGLRTYVQLFVVIAAANDVKCDVASNSTFVYAYGFAEDIDASHALYASLVVQMVKASEAYISSGAHRPTPTITARLNFQLAFGARVGQAAVRGPRGGTAGGHQAHVTAAGTAIALRNKDIELKDFYRQTSEARGTWRATSATAGYSSAARRAGDRAGRRARLGTSPELAGARARTGRGDGPRRPTREGLRRRGVRADVVRPGRRARQPHDRLLRTQPHAAAGGTVRLGRVRAALRRRRARASRSVRKRWPAAGAAGRARPARASPRRTTNAHGDDATIAVPDDGTTWALRELVVLHEIAHHLCDADPPHGPEFVATFCELAEAVMGAEVGHVLRVVYAKEGVR